MRKTLGDKKVAIHFQNGLGNFIQLSPAMQALAELHDAKIDVILDSIWRDSRRSSVLGYCSSEQWPLINEVKDFQDGFNKEDYAQLYYTLHGEDSEAKRYFIANAGYESSKVNWRAEKCNEVDYYMNEVYRLGYRGKVPDKHCIPGLPPPEDFRNLMQGENRTTFRIGFCNGYFAGSKWHWERKGWPHFEELAILLRKFFDHHRLRIHLFGRGPVEKKWADEVLEKNKDMEKEAGVVSFINYNIGKVVSMVKKMHLMITTDTGLMHLADAAKIPMVVLFGPTLVSKCGPYNKEHRLARSPLRCVPCQQTPLFHVCKEWRCMQELKPWMVMRVIREYIHDLYRDNKIESNDFRESLSNVLSLK